MGLVVWLLPKLSRRALWALASFAGAAFHRFDRRSRNVALENLRCAFPRLSERRRELIARGAARNFARTFLDLFWTPNLLGEGWRRWLRPEGLDSMLERRARAGGCIMCSAHFGNYEWGSLCAGFLGLPTLIVAQEFKNPSLDASFNGLRELSGHRITPRTQAMLKMFRAVKGGKEGWAGAGLLADLTLPPTMPTTALRTFGGLRKCAPILPAVLSERTHAPIIPVSGIPQHDGTCRVIFHPAIEPPPDANSDQIAQCLWDAFERHIRRRPSLWLWHYKHFRYRPAAGGVEHPAYANIDPAFDELIARVDGAESAPPAATGS